MKINNVYIDNWQPPGEKWWASVEAKPTEPLIVATITMTLSWQEYHELLEQEDKPETAGHT